MQAEKSPWMKIFSARLKTASKGRKQGDIAKEIGVVQSNLSMYFSGDHLPSLEVFRALCVSVGVKSDWLLGLDDGAQRGVSVTATGRSAVAANNSTVRTGGGAMDSAERSRLLAIIESQQSVIAALTGAGKGN